ncbi:uncharacterized protein LOC113309491 isoform X2 [Papaver somniferum]|uniref:uncharacterized protein LOC113309491 isoform X2 n=1 Tax=Papaver somniferum TaxID=3469 RepID=UPI000E6F831B|nr:uncharacterized protein LOC113309491 isoform X2 [Papaver somniferum]
MFPKTQKGSWSLIATIGSLIAIVSFIYLYSFPLSPSSLAFFSARQVQDSCNPINGSTGGTNPQPVLNLDTRFPDDSHKAVVYRGAPWKSEIGRWLSGCDSITEPVSIVEKIGGKACKSDCSGQGICNQELGECRCFHGFSGEGCTEKLEMKCNRTGTLEFPYGSWIVSICPTYCDTTRAMCFCGEGTKYPNRPVAETCGFQCKDGWYGLDCSIPSVFSSVQEWPQWLRPSTVDIPDNSHLTKALLGIKATVKKKRPLIYVYDLPPEFNSHLIEGRHFKFECVNRIYDDLNATVWTEQLYGSQMALLESMLASPYRTLNGDEADYFFVPVLDSCIITRADDAPHLSMEEHMGLRSSLTLDFYKKAYDHIIEQHPFWNRSSGRDHIWSFSWDEGACYAPKEIWNSMMLAHWGNTNSKHNHSTSAYWLDNWDAIPSSSRGNHPCYDPEKDFVLPAWKRPDPDSLRLKFWTRSLKDRKKLFYFNGNLGPAYEKGRPETTYSMGIRQKLAEEFGSTPDTKGKLGRQHADDVIVTPVRSDHYYKDLSSSVFCGVLPGDGWSGRMEDSVLHGCIPVVIQDGIFLPYENVLNYQSFAVRISEDDIPNLIKILRGFNETELEFMLENVKRIWQRFLYRDSILLEAERQKTTFGHVEDWAVEFLRLTEDDVFSTFIQVLHYKLHHDPWRQKVSYLKKEYGVLKDCLK